MEYCITSSGLTDGICVPILGLRSYRALQMDNGPEFISNALLSYGREVDSKLVPHEQPRQHGFLESSTGGLGDECFSFDQLHSFNHVEGVIGISEIELSACRVT